MMTTAHAVPAEPIARRRLWRGLYLAPLAWAVAFGVGYVLVARSCEGDNGMHATGLPGARWIDLGVAIGMSCVAALGLAIALGSLREARGKPEPYDARAESRGEAAWWGRELFMARAGVIGSSVFLAGTLLFVYPPLVLNLCSQVR